jgi:predicted NBD/HSP70 family sugar kinase
MLRRINAEVVLRAIRETGPVSCAQISRATGLSRPTVLGVADQLVEAGFVSEAEVEAPPGARRPGRPARLLRFRAEFGHVLGLDIGAHKILALVADLSGRVCGAERRTGIGGSAAGVLEQAAGAIQGALAQAGVGPESLVEAVVGTPGVIDPATGSIALAPQLPGWEGLRLAVELERTVPCRVTVENEVRAALVAELARGAAHDHDPVAYLQIGIGIGCAMTIGGRLHRGAWGASGEIGYLPLFDLPTEAAERGFGAFEYSAGGTAIARLGAESAAQPAGAAILEAAGSLEAVDARAVFAAARRGDRVALDIVDRAALGLARGIASVSLLIDPELVVLGGGLSRAGDLLVDPIRRALGDLVPRPPALTVTTLGDEVVALGAIELALEAARQRLFAFESA